MLFLLLFEEEMDLRVNGHWGLSGISVFPLSTAVFNSSMGLGKNKKRSSLSLIGS